ncbi:hypothetical protein [Thiohalocapsa sp. ML1]
MALFRYALRDDGYLFLGSSETASEQYFRPRLRGPPGRHAQLRQHERIPP